MKLLDDGQLKVLVTGKRDSLQSFDELLKMEAIVALLSKVSTLPCKTAIRHGR